MVPSSSGEHTGSQNANTKPNTLFPYPPFFFSARKSLVQPWSAGEQTILDKSISTLKIKNGYLDYPLPTPKHCLFLFLQQCHKFLSRGGSGITHNRSTGFITGHYFVNYAKDVGWDCKTWVQCQCVKRPQDDIQQRWQSMLCKTTENLLETPPKSPT